MPNGMTQVKFTVASSTASAFKARCKSQGVSMSSSISQLMKTSQPSKCIMAKTDTRPQRRKAVLEFIGLLEAIMQMEEQYRDNIPEQFESRYEAADHACEQLAQAISCFEDAF